MEAPQLPQPAQLMYLKMEFRILPKTMGDHLVEVADNGHSHERIRVAWRIPKPTMRELMFT